MRRHPVHTNLQSRTQVPDNSLDKNEDAAVPFLLPSLLSATTLPKHHPPRHETLILGGRTNKQRQKVLISAVLLVAICGCALVLRPVQRTSATTNRFAAVQPRGIIEIDPSTSRIVYPTNATGMYAFPDKSQFRPDVTPTNQAIRTDQISPSSTSSCWIHFPDSCQEDLCILTHKGDKGIRMPNQDRSMILQQQGESKQSWMMAALFDGHGDFGHQVAQEVLEEMPLKILKLQQSSPSVLLRHPESSDTVKVRKSWTDAFLQVDAGRIRNIKHAGTTGILVSQFNHQLVLASVGDSTALVVVAPRRKLSNNKNATIIAESIHHKPAMPEERSRIENKGGRVFIPEPIEVQLHGASSRVLLPGPLGPNTYALAMSRSLGDVEGKELGYLTAEPDIHVLDLESLNEGNLDQLAFVVLASDGVMDVIHKDNLINALHHALVTNTLPATCRTLIKQAIAGWDRNTQGSYRDDITLAVIKLQL